MLLLELAMDRPESMKNKRPFALKNDDQEVLRLTDIPSQRPEFMVRLVPSTTDSTVPNVRTIGVFISKVTMSGHTSVS